MNENVKEFRRIANELCDLYERKNADYGNAFGEVFKEIGIISALTRISDKVFRLKRMALGNETMVKDETVFDTLADLAAYSIMTIIELEREIPMEDEDAGVRCDAEYAEEPKEKEGGCRVMGYLHDKGKRKSKTRREHDRFCPTCRHLKDGECEALASGMPCVWTLDNSKIKPFKKNN